MDACNSDFQSIFYVDWCLLLGTNHYCTYSHEPDGIMDEVYSKDAVLEAAYRLLSLNREQYFIRLYGGEPTVHPYLSDLVHYLMTSGRDIKLDLVTNALMPLPYYEKLFAQIPPGKLLLEMDLHPRYLDLKKILMLTAMALEQKQEIHFNIHYTVDYEPGIRQLDGILNNLPTEAPVTREFRFPTGDSPRDWMTQMPSPRSVLFAAKGQTAHPGLWSCAGAIAAHVTPAQEITLGLVEGDRSFAPATVQNARYYPGMPQPPAFPTQKEALLWIGQYYRDIVPAAVKMGPVRQPTGPEPPEQKFEFALRRVRPSGPSLPCEANPLIWINSKDKLAYIYSRLADEESKKLYAQFVSMVLHGDRSYLTSPAINEEYAKKLSTISDVTLRGVPATLSETIARAIWDNKPFSLRISLDREWVDNLHEAMKKLEQFRFHLLDCNGSLLLSGEPAISIESPPPVNAQRVPVLSILLTTASDAAGVESTIRHIIDLGLPSYEIIPLLDINSPDYIRATIDQLSLLYPWHIRPYRFNEELNENIAWNKGIDYAAGTFICMLNAGEVTEGNMLQNALAILEDEADVNLVVFETDALAGQRYTGQEAWKMLLNGEWKNPGVNGKVYRTDFARTYARVAPRLASLAEPDLFNFGAFRFSAQVAVADGSPGGRRSLTLKRGPEELVKSFFQTIQSAFDFCQANGLGSNDEDIQIWGINKYIQLWEALSSVARFMEMDSLWKHCLGSEELGLLRSMPALLNFLSARQAGAYHPLQERQEEALFPDAAAVVVSSGHNSGGIRYPVSLVAISKTISDWENLKSAIRIDDSRREWLVVDNGLPAPVGEEMENLCALYPNMRLIRMSAPTSVARCRNAALEVAFGKSIAFLDAPGRLLPGFTHMLDELVVEQGSDLIICGHSSSRHLGGRESGAVMTAVTRALKAGHTSSFVVDRNLLKAKKLKFREMAAEPNLTFLIEVILNASKILCLPGRFATAADSQRQGVAPDSAALSDEIYLYKLMDILADDQGGEILANIREMAVRSFNATWLPMWKTQGNSENLIPDADSFAFAAIIEDARKALLKKRGRLRRQEMSNAGL